MLVAYAAAAKHAERGEFYGGPVHDRCRARSAAGMDAAVLSADDCRAVDAAARCLRRLKPDQNFMGTNWAAFAGDLVAAGGFDTRLGPGGTTGAAGQETEAQRRLRDRRRAAGLCARCHCLALLASRVSRTPEWVLRRAYQHGLEWGIRRHEEAEPAVTAPVRAESHRADSMRMPRAFVLRVLGGEQRRFEAAFHEAKWRRPLGRAVAGTAVGRAAAAGRRSPRADRSLVRHRPDLFTAIWPVARRGRRGHRRAWRLGIGNERRRVMGLEAGVDHQRPRAAPVLLLA